MKNQYRFKKFTPNSIVILIIVLSTAIAAIPSTLLADDYGDYQARKARADAEWQAKKAQMELRNSQREIDRLEAGMRRAEADSLDSQILSNPLITPQKGLTSQRLDGDQALAESRRLQAELERQQQLLLEDSERRNEQARVDAELKKATRQLKLALKAETLEDQALGVLEVQTRFAELAATNPTFRVLIDAANRKLEILTNRENRSAAHATNAQPAAPVAE